MKYTTTPLRQTTNSVHGHDDDAGQSAPDSGNNMNNNNTPTAPHHPVAPSSSWGQMVTRTAHFSQQSDEVSWQVGEVQHTWDPSMTNSTLTRTTAMRFMPYPLRLLQEDEVLYQQPEGGHGGRRPVGFLNDTTNDPIQSILATIDSALEIMRQYDDAEHDNYDAENDKIMALTVAPSQ